MLPATGVPIVAVLVILVTGVIGYLLDRTA